MSDSDTQPASTDSGALEGGSPGASVALRWLLFLAALYTMYFARTLLMPIVVALFFALLLSPLVEFLKRRYVPRPVSAILILCLIGGPLGLLASQLAEPAQRWATEIPQLADQLTQQVEDLTERLTPDETPPTPPQPPEPRGFNFFGLFGDDEGEGESEEASQEDSQTESGVRARIKQSSLEAMITMLSGAPLVIAQLLTAVMLILFLLIFGSGLFVTWVKVFPRIEDKNRSIELMHSIQVELSRYILTVSAINAGLGLVVASALWLLGVEDALLWGVLVGMLNFAPYVGPVIGVVILTLAGVVQYGLVLGALLPATIYFSINMLEAQFVTPLILGRNMSLNPLIIILWLVILGWLWGTVGVLLAVPMLVCFKIAATQTHVMRPWVEMIEAEA